MKVKRGIVWFTTDLRVSDNITLLKAIEECEEIIPFYCLNEDLVKTTAFGFKKCGEHRLSFILDSLQDLKISLSRLGSDLLISYGNPVQVLVETIKKYGVQKVYVKKEVAWEEKTLQSKAEIELWKNKCLLEIYSSSTLYQATDFPFSIKDMPKLFTEFRKKVEKESVIRTETPYPKEIKTPKISETANLESLRMKFPKPYSNDKSAFPFSGGESEAWNRIESYFFKEKNLLQYKETRNGLIGTSYSSKLSPWLAQGCISPKSVYYNVKKLENEVGANDSTYWLIFELLWRDFFRFSMKKYGALYFLKGGIQNKNMDTYQNDPEKIDRWVQGKTGVDFVDANMKELSQTGFLSNRGRQIVASYFCNDLKLDWRYGAAYFEAQLIDYDPCSNWGNWAYIAGVGNDNRNDRYFNIEKQQKTYDPNGEYCKIWL